jgi:transcriptional regulator with XRE-family HTH domain
MDLNFGETIKTLRSNKNLSQQQLADKLFVSRSSVANWESGRRKPDLVLILRLANIFNIDPSMLIDSISATNSSPEVIIVDDEKILLQGVIPILEETIPDANITGFTKASEVIDYAKKNVVNIAFLDIELGQTSGIELCKELMEINPHTNVIFLTSYPDYAQKAWETAASGFLIKPITREDVLGQLAKLRYPLKGVGHYDVSD